MSASCFAAGPEVRTQAGDQILRVNLKGLAYSQERENRDWPTAFDHLPVPNAKTVRDHILLTQFALGSVGADTMAESAEEPRVVGWKISVGTHVLRVELPRAKRPRAKRRIVEAGS